MMEKKLMFCFVVVVIVIVVETEQSRVEQKEVGRKLESLGWIGLGVDDPNDIQDKMNQESRSHLDVCDLIQKLESNLLSLGIKRKWAHAHAIRTHITLFIPSNVIANGNEE